MLEASGVAVGVKRWMQGGTTQVMGEPHFLLCPLQFWDQ